jgi:hypothetical protein
MNYIKGTHFEALIDRAVDGWAEILGFTDKRARNDDGTYMGDDPSTPDINEAYKSGKKKTVSKSLKNPSGNKKTVSKKDKK